MKNIFNKFAFFIALSFVFISCGNLTTSENDDSIPQGKGKITISTDLQNGRSVLPTEIEEYTKGLTWILSGVKAGESKQIGYWEDDNDTDNTAYQKMVADTSLLVDTGTWEFTLTAKTVKTTETTVMKDVLSATISATIETGENTLNFVMQEATGVDAASGSIEFTLKFPKDVVNNVVATLYNYGSNSEGSTKELTISTSSTDNYSFVTYSYPDSTGTTNISLNPGYYILKIELKQEISSSANGTNEDVTINTYSCLIRVAPGLLSEGTYTLENLAQLYTINFLTKETADDGGESWVSATFDDSATTVTYNKYTSFELPTPTKDGYSFLGWYTDEAFVTPVTLTDDGKYFINSDTSLYAKWEEISIVTNAYYVSATGSDNNDGLSYDTPFASLMTAVTKISSDTNTTGTYRTIYICGNVMTTGVEHDASYWSGYYFDSDVGTADAPIEIIGYPDNTEDILTIASDETRRVIYVDSNSYITFKDLTISGGNSESQPGAAMNLSGTGSITLDNVKVKNNTSFSAFTFADSDSLYSDGIEVGSGITLNIIDSTVQNNIHVSPDSTASSASVCVSGNSSIKNIILASPSATCTLNDDVSITDGIYITTTTGASETGCAIPAIFVDKSLTTNSSSNSIKVTYEEYSSIVTYQSIALATDSTATLADEVQKFTLSDANYTINDEGFVESSGGGSSL